MGRKQRRAHKRDTLALVESPAQALNVIEWAHHRAAMRRMTRP